MMNPVMGSRTAVTYPAVTRPLWSTYETSAAAAEGAVGWPGATWLVHAASSQYRWVPVIDGCGYQPGGGPGVGTVSDKVGLSGGDGRGDDVKKCRRPG